jgi:hypothetical protein
MKLSLLFSSIFSLAMFTIGPKAFADHCPNYQMVAHSVHQLDIGAEHFHELVHDVEGYSHLADDAHSLAQAANSFHESIHDGVDCSFIQQGFQQVAQSFYHLQEGFHHAHEIHHNWHVQSDWHRLTWEYNHTQNSIRRNW